jgi:hypothetical protein
VQIAELSAEGGNPAQARVYYQKNLDEFPGDQRRYLVQQKLAALGAAGK